MCVCVYCVFWSTLRAQIRQSKQVISCISASCEHSVPLKEKRRDELTNSGDNAENHYSTYYFLYTGGHRLKGFHPLIKPRISKLLDSDVGYMVVLTASSARSFFVRVCRSRFRSLLSKSTKPPHSQCYSYFTLNLTEILLYIPPLSQKYT